MVADWQRQWTKGKGAELKRQIIPKTSCSDGYGSTGKIEMSSDVGEKD